MGANPAWIEQFFKRKKGVHWFATPFILRMDVERLEETLLQAAEAPAQLRSVALERLRADDIDFILPALLALYVVGNAEDKKPVEALTRHPDEQVKKAAKTCLFELRKRE